MDKQDLEQIITEIDGENSIFADKSHLDTSKPSSRIIGRRDQAKEVARLLLGFKKGHAAPFVSIYGRSGSGKSTVVRYVLENLDTKNIF